MFNFFNYILKKSILIILIILLLYSSGCINNNNDDNGVFDDATYKKGQEKPKIFEEINCIEFDHERDVLVLGADNGFGIYYPQNNTYEFIAEIYNITLSIAIDYENDIYYFGTWGGGIKKYFINEKRYVDFLPEFENQIYIEKLVYDNYNDELIISEQTWPDRKKNIAYYDESTLQLFNYKYGVLTINDFKLNTNNTIEILPEPESVYIEEIIDVEYDGKKNFIFLAVGERNYFNCDIVKINVITEEIFYINITNHGPNFEIFDLSLDSKYSELYVATNSGLFIKSIDIGKINYVDFNGDYSSYYPMSITNDKNNDLFYILNTDSYTSSRRNDFLFIYYPNNRTISKIIEF
jgi:hypothetical protein